MIEDVTKSKLWWARKIEEQRQCPYMCLNVAASCSQIFLTPVHAVESAIFTHCPQVNFNQGSKAIDETVLNMSKDPAVTSLRNEHGADLVQMFGNWRGEAGLG